MKQKLGRKLLSFILTLAMVVGLMPGMGLTARAATNTYTNLIPTDSDTDLSAKQVTFNGIKWYIIKDDSTSETTGTVTLLAADKIDQRNYATQSNTIYKNSSVKEYLDGLTAENGSFKAVANAIESTDLIDVDVTGAKLYLLSFDEAKTLPKNIRNIGTQWWLRTNIIKYSDFEAERVSGTGDMTSGTANIPLSCSTHLNSFGVRPVLKLKLDSVNYSEKSFTVPTVAVTNVSLNTNVATLTVGGTETLVATVSPDNATDKTVKWSVGGTNADAVKLYTDADCTAGNEIGTDATNTLTVYAKGISAGSATVTATSNADSTKTASCSVTVNKADPVYVTPTGLSAFVGQTLADVALPTADNGTWSWTDDTAITFHDIGPTTHFAKFTPSDTDNYTIIENIEVQIQVTEKLPSVPATVTANNRTYDGTEKPLVTVDDSTLEGGTMQYALGTATEATQPYTTSIPTATDAGT